MLVAEPRAAVAYAESRKTMQGATREEQMFTLRDSAAAVRRDIVTMIDAAQLGHIGGDLSVTDILVTLFGAVLNVDPEHPDRPDRDRFVLSKGHCAAALYATLAHCGFFPREELNTFMAPLSMLNGHPDRKKVPGVETNTGPLGHGFPVAVGCALAAKIQGRVVADVRRHGRRRDAGGQQLGGSDDRAALRAREHHRGGGPQPPPAGRAHGGDQAPGPVRAQVGELRVGGPRDRRPRPRALLEAFAPSSTGKPVAVIANTIKGKGVSFIEDRVEWHHKVPNAEQVKAALEELSR